MNPMVVGLVALAIVLVVVVRSVVLSRRSGAASVERDVDRSGVWFERAADAASDGRGIARELEQPLQCPDSSVGDAPELEQRLDSLTHDLAELAATAPTSMDARVCRGVAVSSQTLAAALRTEDGRRASSDHVPANGRQLADRHTEFVIALGDLERHVELL